MTYPSQSASASPFEHFLERWWYEPVTVWTEAFRSFINPQVIFNMEDLAVEREVLSQVGSYGKQISMLSKIIDMLVAHLRDDLSDEEKVVLGQYRALQAQINDVLKEYRGPKPADITIGYLQRLNESLHTLQESRPEEYQRAMDLLTVIAKQNGTGKASMTSNGPPS